MNNITIELCAEDRARLDRILGAMIERPNCERCADSVAGVFKEAMASKEAAAERQTLEEPAAEPEKKVGLVEIQRKVVELSTAGKKEQVRKIVKDYAARVSDIPEDKLAEVWAKLSALEG